VSDSHLSILSHTPKPQNTVVIVLPSISSEDTVHPTREFKLVRVKDWIGTHSIRGDHILLYKIWETTL